MSAVFLLKVIEIEPKLKRQLRTFGFINTYLTCEPIHYPYEVLYVLFKPEKLDIEFANYISALQKNPNFIEVLDLAGKVMIVYRIPKKFKVDYQRFLRGKYSELSKEFQKCFVLEDYKRNESGIILKDAHQRPIRDKTVFHHIFNRTDERKEYLREKLGYTIENSDIFDDIELYDKQDPEKESYDTNDELW
jgi:hypothetical protein